jgi:hypothetical protein
VVGRRQERPAAGERHLEQLADALHERDVGPADHRPAVMPGDDVERLADLVDPAVHTGHRVVHLGLAGDAAAFPDEEHGLLPLPRPDDAGDDVPLGLQGLPQQAVERGRDGVLAGDVERAARLGGLAAEDGAKFGKKSIQIFAIVEAHAVLRLVIRRGMETAFSTDRYFLSRICIEWMGIP